ncbi:mitochondrial large ribosomal subunit l49 [Fusarium langsethiae]|uniref:Large ribosomal subunit protein mL49 n=1 Tax=Fusarium langsethiae TaxID=179993 RepID=A0A0N0DH36_FUSLA|nr:mitochondrial large ribosomal subunit l49 [Fusarium langsethiae]GKT99029.1 unnamed protein product [Fusarium langsethiae]GKU16670.1 unnamed protein product [Fusarium langsethiae]
MRFLVSRALSIGRQAFSQQPVSFTQRASLTTVRTAPARTPTFKKHVSYKPDPQDQPSNPSRKNKIPYKARPLEQPMVPPPAKNPKEVGTYLRYIIKRTPSLQVPVYRKWMSGGNRCIVMIKKVKGDYSKLVKDISDDLDIKAEDIRINPVTQHIEIKGDVYAQTVQWVLNAGF